MSCTLYLCQNTAPIIFNDRYCEDYEELIDAVNIGYDLGGYFLDNFCRDIEIYETDEPDADINTSSELKIECIDDAIRHCYQLQESDETDEKEKLWLSDVIELLEEAKDIKNSFITVG